jgi:hypothetical protein
VGPVNQPDEILVPLQSQGIQVSSINPTVIGYLMIPLRYPLDYYPPFCSGCGFVLSWDLVLDLTRQPLPDYRLLDPPFGIHLCGPPSDKYLVLKEPVVPVHDDRVRGG